MFVWRKGEDCVGFDDCGDEDLEEEGDNGVTEVSGGKGEEDSVCGIRLSLDSGNMGGRDDCGGELSEVWLKKGNVFS
jgi:hypothetical protein